MRSFLENMLKSGPGLFVLLVFIFVCCLFGLGSWGLTETSESRYAQIGAEMMESGDFSKPQLMGIYHFHKPPVTYQITALGYHLFGKNEFGARFFLQLALIIQLLLIFKIARLLFNDRKKAILAMLVYFSFPLVLISVRNLTTDAYLNSTILASIYFWLSAIKGKHKTIQLLLFYLCLGLIINIKGPVGLIFPVMFVISYSIIFKTKFNFSIGMLTGWILFIFLSGIWAFSLTRHYPWLIEYFLEEQIFKRVNSNSYNRAKPIWYYLILLPAVFLPWIWPLSKALFNRKTTESSQRKLDRLLIWNTILILIVFSAFSTKLILYVLPISLYMALLVVRGLDLMSINREHNAVSFIAILGLVILVGASVYSRFDSGIDMDHLMISGISIFLLLFYLWLYRREQSNIRVEMVTLLFGLTLVAASTSFFRNNELMVNSVKPIIEYIRADKDLRDRQPIVFNYLLPSAQYYTGKEVITVNNGHNTVQRDIRFQTDQNWKKSSVDIRDRDKKYVIDSLMRSPSYILVRRRGGKIEMAELFEDTAFEMKDFGKWVLFY